MPGQSKGRKGGPRANVKNLKALASSARNKLKRIDAQLALVRAKLPDVRAAACNTQHLPKLPLYGKTRCSCSGCVLRRLEAHAERLDERHVKWKYHNVSKR